MSHIFIILTTRGRQKKKIWHMNFTGFKKGSKTYCRILAKMIIYESELLTFFTNKDNR